MGVCARVCSCVCVVCVCVRVFALMFVYTCMLQMQLTINVCMRIHKLVFLCLHTRTQACIHYLYICHVSYSMLSVLCLQPIPSLHLSLPPFLLHSLPPHTDIQTRNYYAGLEKYNQMVTTGSFSEIGSFIPGLKVLLQLALQLNI